MAEKIQISDIEIEDKEYIQSTLEILVGKTVEECFDTDETNVYLPLAFARTTFDLPIVKMSSTENIEFKAELRSEQITIYNFVVDRLKLDGHAIIAARPGFGKTITAIACACALKIKVAIVVNKLVLIKQWQNSISTFVPNAICQYVTSSTSALDEAASFYIVNAINVKKKSHKFWEPIKFLIVDELHQIVTKTLTQSLLRFVPNCILGLSATPFRFDEYDKAIKWFFGANLIGKRLNMHHSVYIIKTGWVPKAIRYTRKGVDWNSVLEEQCENVHRNNLIINACLAHPDRTFLILVKRVAHAKTLECLFQKENVRCCTLVGSAVDFDKTCKILIGTTSKIGVGFDHAAIDALCIAADVKNYFVQFLGRAMRRPEVCPIVIDFDDDYGPLNRHLAERIKEYQTHGGTIV